MSIRIAVTENVRTMIGSVRVTGNQAVAQSALTGALGLQPGQPFFLTQMAVDRDAIQVRYADLGFQSATVDSNPGLSADGTRADVVFTCRRARLFSIPCSSSSTTDPPNHRSASSDQGVRSDGLAALTESHRACRTRAVRAHTDHVLALGRNDTRLLIAVE